MDSKYKVNSQLTLSLIRNKKKREIQIKLLKRKVKRFVNIPLASI